MSSDTSADNEILEDASTESVEDQQDFAQFGISHSAISSAPVSDGKNRKLYCFSCHRQESHFFALKGRSHYYLMVGLTFGLIVIFGPYRCRCCGHKRLCRHNFLNLRYHLHRRKYTRPSRSGAVRSGSSRRSSSRRNGVSRSQMVSKTDDDRDRAVGDLDNGETGQKRRRRRKRLKAVPVVESIGKERRERRENEILEQNQNGDADFTMDGLLSSFETEQSLKAKAAEAKLGKTEIVGKKGKPSKEIEGKPKRRHAKKERLTGPKLYCFTCKQQHEHFHHLKTSNYFSFFFGVSLGLISLIGPYRCSVCSHRRMFGLNLLHPKYYIRHLIERAGNGYK